MRKYDPKKAILFSAVIFGGIHFIPVQVINAFFIGIVLGWIYYRTKNLWVPILIHIIHNSVAFILGVEGAETKLMDSFDQPVMYYGSFILAALATYVGYFLFQKYSIQPATDDNLSV